jgi:hypothetical protein
MIKSDLKHNKYPTAWSIEFFIDKPVNFYLPDEIVQTSCKTEEVCNESISVSISVRKISTKEYANLKEYEEERSNNYDTAMGRNWNYINLGYEEINGRQFFKNSIAHQVEELRYATLVNGSLFLITFRTQGSVPYEKLSAYSAFLKLLSSLKFY